jgi:hypothetical protein
MRFASPTERRGSFILLRTRGQRTRFLLLALTYWRDRGRLFCSGCCLPGSYAKRSFCVTLRTFRSSRAGETVAGHSATAPRLDGRNPPQAVGCAAQSDFDVSIYR